MRSLRFETSVIFKNLKRHRRGVMRSLRFETSVMFKNLTKYRSGVMRSSGFGAKCFFCLRVRNGKVGIPKESASLQVAALLG